MQNRYDEWNELKKNLSSSEKIFTFKVREIYWVKIGQNIGYEVYSKGDDFVRPVLVLRKDDMFHFGFTPINKQKKNYAILSQVKFFSTKRIKTKFGKISIEEFENLKIELKRLMQL